ncbi:MAG: hypothetical protein HYZ74_04805 [Elusimicrobia bacterium]|nr:hypothetical protein [Elusimicrobiota bacterium]
MTRKILVLAAIISLSIVPRSRTIVLEEGFLPPNNLKIAVGSLEAKGITQEQFNAVMDRAEEIYTPVIAARGGKLVLRRLWDDPTVNASAQRDGDDYVLNMYGGLARHESITQDGMALVVCHELGHHIGGAPKYYGEDWASNEGQADYFANLKCLRLMFSAPGAEAFSGPEGDEAASNAAVAKAACAKSHAKPADKALCARGAMAGMSVTTLFRVLRRETKLPRFDTPDPEVVTEMYDNHPGTQCRLDTYFSGSLCDRPVGEVVDEQNPAPGTCTTSSGHTVGLRPLCWYFPPADPTPQPPAAARAAAHKAPVLASSLQNPDLWKGL